jgi:hypothetical protein
MSKRKPDKASKRARGPKMAARAQNSKQAIVRSRKETESLERQGDAERKAAIVENRATALQNGLSQVMRDNHPKKGFGFSLATANMQAYQATLLEMTQANMQFAFEFGQRIATIRSPFEFFAVAAEFTSRRIDMFRRYSKQLTAVSVVRRAPIAQSSAGP